MTETPSALEGLETLRAHAREAEETVRLAILECSKAKRQPHRVCSALRDYHTAVATGERPADPKVERKLLAAGFAAESQALPSVGRAGRSSGA